MKKRVQHLLSALLTLCMAFTLYSLPASATEAAPAGAGTKDSPWDISAEAGTDNVSAWYEGSEENGYTLIVSGEGRMTASFRSVDPPWKSIKSNIVSVEIQNGVTNVGAYAFNFCKALKSVSLPDSLTEIGTYAFHSTGVKHLTVPVNVAVIGRMIANPTTYYEVLGNPEDVNNHAFSTSLVSVPDQETAEALNACTNVSAIIVLDGGVYGETDEDLANLSYELIAPVKADSYFSGWYRNADFSGQRLSTDRNGRTTTNINNIYYTKWSDTPEESPSPVPSDTPEESPSPAPSNTPEESPSPAPSNTPEESPSPAPSNTPEGNTTPAPSDPDTATPSPTPPQTDSGNATTPPDSGNSSGQNPEKTPEPGKADTPDQSGTMHSPKTGDNSSYGTTLSDTAVTKDHSISQFLLISATVAAVILAVSIIILMRRKYGNNNNEGRKER